MGFFVLGIYFHHLQICSRLSLRTVNGKAVFHQFDPILLCSSVGFPALIHLNQPSSSLTKPLMRLKWEESEAPHCLMYCSRTEGLVSRNKTHTRRKIRWWISVLWSESGWAFAKFRSAGINWHYCYGGEYKTEVRDDFTSGLNRVALSVILTK